MHAGRSPARKVTVMAYVIVDTCEKDDVCATGCPDEAISHGKYTANGVEYDQYYIDPDKCNECGTCESLCPSGSIFLDLDMPAKFKHFPAVNAGFFAK
jgi:ferredoxin